MGVVLAEKLQVFQFMKIKPPPPLWLNRVKWNPFIHFHGFQECVNQLLYSGYHLHSPSLHHHCHHRKYHQCDVKNGDKSLWCNKSFIVLKTRYWQLSFLLGWWKNKRDCLFQSGVWSIILSCQEHSSCEYGIIRGEMIYQDRLSYHSFLL